MSRRRQLQKKLKKGLARPNVAGLSAADSRERGGAVRSCCPCRVGWDAYEATRDEVERLCKDDDATVRFNALHVRQDAVLAERLADNHERRRAAEAARNNREASRSEDARRSAVRRAKARA